MKEKLAKFAGSKGISSDDYYDTGKSAKKESNGGSSKLDKAKQVGAAILETAKEKAIEVNIFVKRFLA